MTLSLSPVFEGSAGSLARLQQACFPEESWDAAALAEIMAIGSTFGLLAFEDVVAVGFVLAFDLKGECEILSLGVLPEMRRRGAARALLAAVCAEARRRGAGALILEAAIDNNAALALYRGLGFTTIACRKRYYRRGQSFVDALVLRLSLDGASVAT